MSASASRPNRSKDQTATQVETPIAVAHTAGEHEFQLGRPASGMHEAPEAGRLPARLWLAC